MASKADVSSAAKPNKAAATMATGSDGTEAGAEESAAPTGVQQLPPEVWAAMSSGAQHNYRRNHKKGARKQGGKEGHTI